MNPYLFQGQSPVYELAHYNHSIDRTLRGRVQTTTLQKTRVQHQQDHLDIVFDRLRALGH